MMRPRLAGFLGFSLSVLLALAAPVSAQQATIAGRVIDGSTMQPLASVQVQIVGSASATGVLSDASGNFSISVSSGSYSVVFTLIGHQTHRVDGVSVANGGTERVEVQMTSTVLALDPLSVTVNRGREERTSVAPAQVNVVTAELIEEISATSAVDYVKAMPGVDVIQTGINQSNTVTRGFNNVFSGALLVLTDNRYARVPSLRLNAYNMIPATPLDVERVEVVLGPAAALYGPNSANGVMHIITTSPIDKPGSSFSIAGGGRNIFHGVFRQAWKFSDKAGLKFSGQYFRGDDFEYFDPSESGGTNPLIGARNFKSERFSGEVRLDLRPWDNPDDEIIFTYGLNELVSSIELTGIGAGQGDNWRYQFGQVQVSKGRLYAQAFINNSGAGDSFLLRTGQPLVDKSKMIATQLQYGLEFGGRLDLLAGFDYSKTTPNTEGTINGSNEDFDETTEYGAYVHGTLSLTDRVDLVAALRADDHEHLEETVFSPRAALVFTPAEGHSFRGTYNRAFGTPTTNNLFLDLVAGQIPITPTIGYNVRAFGVPSTGLTFRNTCAGGVNNHCMYSPFAPGVQMPATGAALWDAVVVPLALSDPTLMHTLGLLGISAQAFASIVGAPQPGELASNLLRFNSENPAVPFLPDPGVSPVGSIKPTITNTFELGYNGLIGDKLRIAVAGYRTKINDFVGPLRVETPSVFLDGNSVAQYLVTRLTGAGVPLQYASGIAAAIAPTAASVPLGTIQADQRTGSDLILTYRNFGDVEFYGADLGLEYHATDKVTMIGSYSRVSADCHDLNNDGICTGSTDIALNAPKNKGSFGMRYDNKLAGTFVNGRVRYSDGFPMNSGVYVGDVESYSVFDLNFGYRVPGYSGMIVSVTLNNAFNKLHQEFIGAPRMGRIGMLKIQYEF